MANKDAKSSQNVPGTGYVDNTCIGCGLCQDRLPSCFKRDQDTDLMYVYKQPDAAEKEAFNEAMENCPVNAIGNDG